MFCFLLELGGFLRAYAFPCREARGASKRFTLKFLHQGGWRIQSRFWLEGGAASGPSGLDDPHLKFWYLGAPYLAVLSPDVGMPPAAISLASSPHPETRSRRSPCSSRQSCRRLQSYDVCLQVSPDEPGIARPRRHRSPGWRLQFESPLDWGRDSLRAGWIAVPIISKLNSPHFFISYTPTPIKKESRILLWISVEGHLTRVQPRTTVRPPGS
jgi:hypothetical protein